MIGGPDEAVKRLDPIFATLAPGVEAAERTPGRDGEPDTGRARLPALRAQRRRPLREDGPQRHRVRPDGRLRRGPQHPPATPTPVPTQRDADAETAPLEQPGLLPLRDRRRRGGRGLAPRQRRRLLAARPDRLGACTSRRQLEDFSGRVSDSGEGRWTSIAAIEEGVPAPVLSAALYSRFASRDARRLRQQGAVGDAQAIRRPRREAGLSPRPGLSLEVCEDAESAAARAAELIGEAAAASIAERGSFTLALSGGRTPRRMLELLVPAALADPGVDRSFRSTNGSPPTATRTAT